MNNLEIIDDVRRHLMSALASLWFASEHVDMNVCADGISGARKALDAATAAHIKLGLTRIEDYTQGNS